MFRTEGKGLIVKTKPFSFFVAKATGTEKAEVLAINALSARLKILFKQLRK